MILRIGRHIDAQFFDHAARFLAIGRGAFDGIGPAKTQAKGVIHAKLIALGVSAKIIVVVEDEDALARARHFPIKMRGRKAADAAPNDDEIESFTGVLRSSGIIPEGSVTQRVRRIERARMTASQSGNGRRIVGRQFFWGAIGEQMPRHHGSTGGYGHAVEKVTARNIAVHSQFAVVVVAHHVPCILRSLGWNIRTALSVGLLDGQFRTLESNAAMGAIAKGFVDRTPAAAEGKGRLAGKVIGGAVDVDEFD